jgi:hypothetical protein
MRLVICILAALTLAPPSQAQQRLNCAPRDIVVNALTQKHGEHPVLRGVSGRAMIEIWLAESGSFSVVVTQPSSGLSCMLAAGNSMSPVSLPKPGKKL